MRDTMRKKFSGALLGGICGDVLGAPVEGMSAERIRAEYGRVTTVIPDPDGVARYTDDTQMTLALGRAMVRRGAVDAGECAAAYAAAFDPLRGYGRSATEILRALQGGADWQRTGEMQFPGGSFGNGAAMRIAPVGLVYGTVSPAVLRREVKAAVCATHVHPEAIDGAVLLARAIGRARDLDSCSPERLRELMPDLLQLINDPDFGERLNRVRELLLQKASGAAAHRLLGSGVRTRESVPFALFLALRYVEEPLQGLLAAVNAGGDTDTVAAMTGSILGALHGTEIFPADWLELLEKGEDGVQGLLEVADGLYELARRRGAVPGC